MPLPTRFHSAIVEVQDFEAGVQDYSRLIGRDPSWIGLDRGGGRHSAFFALPNMALELRGSLPECEAREGLIGLRLGIDVLGPGLEAELAARGVATLGRSRACLEDQGDRSTRVWESLAIDPGSSRGIGVELVAEEPDDGIPSASDESAAEAESMIVGLDHVVVFSAAPDSTRAFYGDGLGIRLALDRSFEDRGVRLLFFRIAGVTIEIGSRLGGVIDEEGRDRFGGLAWQVADVDRIRKRLLGEDFDVSEVRSGNKAGTRVCTVRNPVHGVPTLLIQPVAR